MKITYTGRNGEFPPEQQKKLDAKTAKIAKLLDGRRGEKEAHVILTTERHLHNAEITVNYYDHAMVGASSEADEFTAICSAMDKLEKQILKHRAKWRTKRTNGLDKSAISEDVSAGAEEAFEPPAAPTRVFRIAAAPDDKPMTVEEALLEIDQDRDYLVYRDAESDRVSVLLRRRDGNFDLIEA
jgi:putative sigma-54 modulation protein